MLSFISVIICSLLLLLISTSVSVLGSGVSGSGYSLSGLGSCSVPGNLRFSLTLVSISFNSSLDNRWFFSISFLTVVNLLASK